MWRIRISGKSARLSDPAYHSAAFRAQTHFGIWDSLLARLLCGVFTHARTDALGRKNRRKRIGLGLFSSPSSARFYFYFFLEVVSLKRALLPFHLVYLPSQEAGASFRDQDTHTMSGQLPPRSSKSDPSSDKAASESTSLNSNWSVPGSVQHVSPGFLTTNDSVSGREDPAGPNLSEHPGAPSVSGKVAIPRSARTIPWTSMGRTSRACENCREQKAKCSGHHPTCNRCKDAGIRCSYGDRKREKILKWVNMS